MESIFFSQDCLDPLDLEDHQDQEVNRAQMVPPVGLGPGDRRENLVHRAGAEEVGVSSVSLNVSCYENYHHRFFDKTLEFSLNSLLDMSILVKYSHTRLITKQFSGRD